jgi:hypothetical protein
VQDYIRQSVVSVLAAALTVSGQYLQRALDWFRSEPLTPFHFRTTEQVVARGEIDGVIPLFRSNADAAARAAFACAVWLTVAKRMNGALKDAPVVWPCNQKTTILRSPVAPSRQRKSASHTRQTRLLKTGSAPPLLTVACEI